MAKRKVETMTLDDGAIVVTSEALGYEQAEDLLPDIAQLVGSCVAELAQLVGAEGISGADDVVKLLPALGPIASQLGGGKLKRLVPKLLAGTSVVMPDENSEKISLHLMTPGDRATCFELRPDLYFRILWHAGKTTFGRFFPAGARRAPKATPPSA